MICTSHLSFKEFSAGSEERSVWSFVSSRAQTQALQKKKKADIVCFY